MQPDQCGSEVLPERLRFDFAWPESVPTQELAAIEEEVRRIIALQLPVYGRRSLLLWLFV